MYRVTRTTKPMTRVLGPQYRRSVDRIEIDITYACDLKCFNCNRSCRQAPSSEAMELAQIEHFVSESLERGKRWESIAVVGGEPTLHPQLREILDGLVNCLGRPHSTSIALLTNGLGPQAKSILASLPNDVIVVNSKKTDTIEPDFEPFNVAPVDLARFRWADFRNGCIVMSKCGMGLTPYGYYICAVAGGIDRVVGYNLGRQALPADNDLMLDQCERLCRLCGHFIPKNPRLPLLQEQISPTWQRIYERWREARPKLTRYGSTLT
jgi:hypothetical protein